MSRRTGTALLAFGLIVLGCKLVLIADLGNDTPLNDQWGIAWLTLKPMLEGRLHALDLLQSNAIHRIALTRIEDILLLYANHGVWNTKLEMIVNALEHTVALTLLLALLLPACPAARRPALLVFATLLFSLPYDYANTLLGCHSQIYFSLLFTLLAFWLLEAPALGRRWWLGYGCALIGYVSYADGMVTLAICTLLAALRWYFQPAHDARMTTALLLLAASTAIAAALLPHASYQLMTGTPDDPQWATPTARSPQEFLQAFWIVASWPSTALAPLFYAPLLVFLWQRLRAPGQLAGTGHLIFALGLWALAQFVILAYGRGRAPMHPRYTDLLNWGLLLNYLCLLIWTGEGEQRWRLWASRCWAGLFLLVLMLHTTTAIHVMTHFDTPQAWASEHSIRDYLATGNSAALSRQAYPQVAPFPRAEQMKQLLDDPTIRHMMAPDLLPANAARQATWVTLLIDRLHRIGMLLLLAGIALALWRLAARWRTPATTAS